MAYSITVEQLGESGLPIRAADAYETADEDDAITTAAFAVDLGEADRRVVATVRDPSGQLVVSYARQPKRDG